jgi:hypothetical protein
MREVVDGEGTRWQVVTGRESWGATCAIFVPLTGSAPARQTLLGAESVEAAERELGAMDDRALLDLLRRSEEKRIS